jgi:hypothetical protein
MLNQERGQQDEQEGMIDGPPRGHEDLNKKASLHEGDNRSDPKNHLMLEEHEAQQFQYQRKGYCAAIFQRWKAS